MLILRGEFRTIGCAHKPGQTEKCAFTYHKNNNKFAFFMYPWKRVLFCFSNPEKAIRTFITSLLDYSNVLYSGLTSKLSLDSNTSNVNDFKDSIANLQSTSKH